MRKTKQLLALLLAGCVFIAGCGRRDTEGNSPMESTASLGNAPQNGDGTQTESSTQSQETPSPTAGTVTLEQGYSDPEREVSIIGLKEYKKLKSDKYTDKAEKGKKFLVLFLKIRNHTNEKIYFNVNYLSAEADGKAIENTALFNEPEGYPTVFSHIPADSYYGGFIAWEVPENWKKMEVTYEGWRESDGLTLNCRFTRKDLKEPEEYNTSDYAQ